MRWRMPLLGMLCAAVLALLGILLFDRVLYGRDLRAPDTSLATLQPVLGGHNIVVQTAPGLWLEATEQGTLLQNHASLLGETQRVNLCEQQAQAADDPKRLVPLRVLGTADDLARAVQANLDRGKSAHVGLRKPLLVGAQAKPGMPGITLRGRATADWQAAPLQLRVHGTGAAWAVAGDGAHAIQADVQTQAFSRQAWVVWRKPALINAPTLATAQAFDYGLRIVRSAEPGCDAGALELSLFAAGVAARPGHAVPLTFFPAAGGAMTASLPVGQYQIPSHPADLLEDHALFLAARDKGLIRLTAQGLVEVAPADLPASLKLGPQASLPNTWKFAADDERAFKLVRQLYSRAQGSYVRKQIARFNQDRMWSALRVRVAKGEPTDVALHPARWRVSVDAVGTAQALGLPAVAARLFVAPPSGWSDWLQVANWPQSASEHSRVVYRLPLSSVSDATYEMLLLGKLVSVDGGTLLNAPRPACDGPGCATRDMLQHITLRPLAGAQQLALTVEPDTHFNTLRPAASEFRHVRVLRGRLEWVQAPQQQEARPVARASVSIAASDGTVLLDHGVPTDAARQLGVAALVGLAPAQSNSVGGVLARLGERGQTQVQARLTLEPTLQALGQQALQCVAIRGHRMRQGQCQTSERLTTEHPQRSAGLVVLDADSGAILASAGAPLPDANTRLADVLDFDRFNPGQSSLRNRGWEHDGGAHSAAGSTYKLVSALGLELAATHDSQLDKLLGGMPPASVDAQGAAAGFVMRSGCYPEPCANDQPGITTNFDGHKPIDYAKGGRFGLKEALAYSINTWFAWQAERSDRTLRVGTGVPDALALDGVALDALRPVQAMAHRLGFEQSFMLDGGLLPTDFAWRRWDALRPMPSGLDPVTTRHEVRQNAIGLRMQTTPLQMARVAAAIGSGHVARPFLLAELDGHQATPERGPDVGVRLDRIRAGMQGVVATGTARSTFAGASFATLRSGLYAKTGTAPYGNSDLNTSWFVGYLEPGSIPGENRRLAFACFVSHTPLTGGAHAAPVVAAMLEGMVIKASASRRSPG